jgi:hypothetical protein
MSVDVDQWLAIGWLIATTAWIGWLTWNRLGRQ